MKHILLGASAAIAMVLSCGTAHAQQVELGNRTIPEAAAQLKPGQFIWAGDNGAEGPALVIVNLKTQKLVLFKNGVPIGASTVSSGSPGRETPTGVFTILQKRKEHYSSTYNNAPMPNMQRLTERGIALHAGKLPGYPASHGCIRLPHAFSGLLFGATNVGMTVVITDIPAVPVKSGTPAMITADAGGGQTLAKAAYEWHPERSKGGEGIVSVIVSTADQRALVMRDGIEIGSSPVRVAGATRRGDGLCPARMGCERPGLDEAAIFRLGPGDVGRRPGREALRYPEPVPLRCRNRAAAGQRDHRHA